MEAKKVLVTEKIADVGLQTLRAKGYEVDVKLGLSPEQLKKDIVDYDALIVRSATAVTADVLDAAENLKIIGRAGVTVDNIDIEAATERDIIVCNAPVSNIVTAAEHTFALLLACARNICQANASMHEGKWERIPFTGTELYEKTLAIFGLGRIGGLVAERARAFGMNVVGHDPYCSPERAQSLGVTLLEDVDEICAIADFITVHLPLTDDTYHMFGPRQFSAMKDGVIVVNTARPGTLLRHRRVRGRALHRKPPARVPERHPHPPHCGGHLRSAASRRRSDCRIRVGGFGRLHRAHRHQHLAAAAGRDRPGGALCSRLSDDGAHPHAD